MNAKPKILTVDDRPQNLYLLQRVLSQLNVDILQAASGAEALGLALENDFCVAIVDVQMPEMDGYELVELMRGNERTATLPVIFVSAIYSDEYHHRKAYDAGAVDFMSKPFIPEILISKVKVFIDLYNKRRNLQDLVEQLNGANTVLSKRALQLETSSQVGKQVTGILELDELLDQVVNLLRERFGYYMVSVWMLNDARDSVELKASSKTEGQLEPGYTIDLNSTRSIIARVCHSRQMYLCNDVVNDPVYLEEPGLQDARAEMALPLHVQQEQLGVLDIQSDRPDAFDADDITALQTMADQIAVAIRNARLYSQVVQFSENLEGIVVQRTNELQRAYQTLEQMDKNKTDFIAVAGHELRTPLTLIRGYTEMLKEMLAEKPEVSPFIQGILTGQDRLLEVVNSMLDISKIDSATLKLQREMTSLRVIVHDVNTNFMSALKERNITLTITDMNLPIIKADTDLMYKLFGHLVVNAIKFTPDGGRITISGEVIEPDPQAAALERYVKIAVADTGVGIDPMNHELIFEKFFQTGQVQFHSTGKTKFKGGGPGLGLAISRGIVKAHGGRIWVESPGHDEEKLPGSTFYVLLPVE